MLSFEMRSSSRLVQQVAEIERFSGRWERLSLSPAIASSDLSSRAALEGARAALLLDSSAPVQLGVMLEKFRFDGASMHGDPEPVSPALIAYQQSLLADVLLSLEGVDLLYQIVAETTDGERHLRRTNVYFLASPSQTGGEEIVFPTTGAFVIEQRMQELLDWVGEQLNGGAYHPLFVIGTFHLLFLQIHPYPTANHRLSLALMWRMLNECGYSFVQYAHFAPQFLRRSRQYYAALRQAERTARGNWATLNIWLEFYLEALAETARQLSLVTDSRTEQQRLTTVQRRILEVVRSQGSATREVIATATGINLNTVKYNLSVLTDRGCVAREGGGRTTSYRVI